MKNVGVYGWVLVVIAVSMIWHVDGEPVLDKKKAPAYFYWDLILVVASAMVVASQITSANSGITTMLGQLMAPLFGLPEFVFLFALGFIKMPASENYIILSSIALLISLVLLFFNRIK